MQVSPGAVPETRWSWSSGAGWCCPSASGSPCRRPDRQMSPDGPGVGCWPCSVIPEHGCVVRPAAGKERVEWMWGDIANLPDPGAHSRFSNPSLQVPCVEPGNFLSIPRSMSPYRQGHLERYAGRAPPPRVVATSRHHESSPRFAASRREWPSRVAATKGRPFPRSTANPAGLRCPHAHRSPRSSRKRPGPRSPARR